MQGTVRRIGVQILDASKDERVIEVVNPARNGSGELWRSALVYLVLADTPADLSLWRQRAATLNQPSLYFVFPPEEMRLDRSRIREMIAVMKVLDRKDPATHAYEVLDGRYTRLRRELRQEFDQAFGNSGLRSGTMVVRAGQGERLLPVDSWNQLLPAILADLDKQFCNQVRVRCGSFNQWQDGGNWSKIENVVKGILKFESCDDYWELCTGKKRDLAGSSYHRRRSCREPAAETRRSGWSHGLSPRWMAVSRWRCYGKCGNIFTTAGDREFSTLFSRLVEPPYGIPNAIIPILVALVFRTEGSRIGIYESGGAQPKRIETESTHSSTQSSTWRNARPVTSHGTRS